MTRNWRASLAFIGWTVVGAGAVLGVLTILTIGIFVLPGAALVAGLLAWRGPQLSRRLVGPGLLTGAGVIPLYIAFLNRAGPGMVCTTSATSGSCTQEMSPWPWIVAGLCLVAAGAALGLVMCRSVQHAGG
jgi:hypothetical protein